MARRTRGLLYGLAHSPWPVGVVLGLIGFVVIRYGIGWCLGLSHNPINVAMGHALAAGSAAPLAWSALGLCWMAAGFSAWSSRQRSRLLDRQTGIETLQAMSWHAFEGLVGEAFRRQGYAIQRTGGNGADGGIDLILRKNDQMVLVQCKHWKSQRVDVKVVREMYGLLAHHGASAVKIVAIGDYTADAMRFVEGKPIELINGSRLLALIREVQIAATKSTPQSTVQPVAEAHETPATINVENSPAAANAVPICPHCGTIMILRVNRQTRSRFWGCPAFPACRGTRPA